MAGSRFSFDSSAGLEELMHGMNEWRNIQDIVRLTFNALHDVIKAQGETIRSLERSLELKVSKEDFFRHMRSKVSVEDLNQSLSLVEAALDQKVDLELLPSHLERKADREDISRLRSNMNEISQHHSEELQSLHSSIHRLEGAIDGKANWQSLDKFATKEELSTKASISEVNIGLQSRATSDVALSLEQKVGRSEFRNFMEDFENKLIERVTVEEINHVLSRKADSDMVLASLDEKISQNDLNAIIDGYMNKRLSNLATRQDLECKVDTRELFKFLEKKVNIEDFREIRTMCSHSLAHVNQVHEISEQLRDMPSNHQMERFVQNHVENAMQQVQQALITSQKELVEILNKKAYKVDVQKALKKKADLDFVQDELNAKASIQSVQDILRKKLDVSDLDRFLDKKANTTELGALLQRIDALQLEHWKHRLDAIQADCHQKVNVSDISSLLLCKADSQDVERKFADLESDLNARISSHEFTKFCEQQSRINHIVDHELRIGRWIWKSGRVKGNYSIPWNVQSVNTCPEMFLWERDSSLITAVAPGLYQIVVGFFTDQRLPIHILVNEESVLTIHPHDSHSLIRRERHTAGHVSGTTHSDFLALPARARISVTYAGDDETQAFLVLHKL